MIYPGKRKVRMFKGGGMASLFDNPGTYLGIQYIPTKQELPDIDGIQYLAQMEQSKLASAAKSRDEASKVASERFKNLSEMVKGIDGLTGESMAFMEKVQSDIDGWYNRYNTPETMNSTEAIQDMTRIQNEFTRGTLALKNNKEVWKEKYDAAEKVRNNVYVSQGQFMIPDAENPGEVKPVSVDEYYKEKEGKYKDVSPLTVEDLFNWRRNYSSFRLSDPFNVRQYDSDTTRKYIDESFKSFATNIDSIQGGEQLSALLKNAGINPENLDITEFKMKIKNGDINAANLFKIFSKNLDSQARDSMYASMVENGINPHQVVRTEKDAEGNEFNVTAFDDYLYEMYMGEKSKKLGSETEVSIDDPSTAKNADGTLKAGNESVVTALTTRVLPIDDFSQNFNGASHEKFWINAYNPNTDKKEYDVPTLKISNMQKEDYEQLNGDTLNFKEVTDDQTVYFNGYKAVIGRDQHDGTTSSGAIFSWTPIKGNVYARDMNSADGKTQTNVLTAVRRIWVNEEGLQQFKDVDGNPVTLDSMNKNKVPNIRKIKNDQILRTLTQHGIKVDSAEDYFKLSDMPGLWTGDGLYEVTVEVPVSNFTALGGTEDKAAQEVLAASKMRSQKILREWEELRKKQFSLQNVFGQQLN